MAKNLGRLDLLRPGALAFKDLMNSNWEAIDALNAIQRELPVDASIVISAGAIVAVDSSGNLTMALDGSGYDPVHYPIGFALSSSVLSGSPVKVRCLGRTVAGLTIEGSPSPGDSIYVSSVTAGAVSASPGPNNIQCGICIDASTIFFRPRLK